MGAGHGLVEAIRSGAASTRRSPSSVGTTLYTSQSATGARSAATCVGCISDPMTSRDEKRMSVWPSSSPDVSQTDPHRAEPSLRTSRFIIDPAEESVASRRTDSGQIPTPLITRSPTATPRTLKARSRPASTTRGGCAHCRSPERWCVAASRVALSDGRVASRRVVGSRALPRFSWWSFPRMG